ncbi:MAG TPA: dihydroorotase [Clostridia bacterium]|nr:dihydroorotase [Clostridia bacterium]
MLIIKGAQLIDALGEKKGYLLIKDNKIKILDTLKGYEDVPSLDLDGLTLMPAFCDPHAHFRDPGMTHKEDLESGSRAALAGGYTTVNLMANTLPIVDNKKIYEDILERANSLKLIDIHQLMAVTRGFNGQDLIDFEDLPSSLSCLSDDGKGILSNQTMYQACLKAKEKDLTIMVHAEDPDLSSEDYRAAEDLITIRDVYLSGHLGAKIHFSHVSTRASMEAIMEGKKRGFPISCEVTPHHLTLWDHPYKVNPPLRKKEDADFLLHAIKTGFVDAISTDHAPHTKEEKKEGAPGMIGLESAFSLCYTRLVEENNLPLSSLSRIMSLGGLEVLGVKNRGLLQDGYDAHLVVVDLQKEYTLKEEDLYSKSKNTPFIGKKLRGQVLMTLVGERILYRRKP